MDQANTAPRFRAFRFEDDQVTEVTADQAASYEGGGFVWLHLEPRADDLPAALPEHVPALVSSALLASETRPRCDVIDSAALINLRGIGLHETEDRDRLVSVRMWVEANRVTSVGRNPLTALRKVENAMLAGKLRDAGDFVAALAHAISTELDPEIAELGDQLDDREGEIEEANIYSLRRRIAGLRSDAIKLRRFVAPDRDALESLAQAELPWISQEDRMHLRAAGDRFARMAEELEAVRERAALLHEQLTDLRAEIVDQRALAIAVMAFIFLPLTFITGLLGMNVQGIPFAEREWAFWGVLLFCLLLGVLVGGWFVARQWLKD
jgi:zinc transporter